MAAKPKKSTFVWLEDDLEKVVELIKSHPCVYDTKSKHYKNLNTRNNAFSSVALEIGHGCSGPDVQEKWGKLREKFGRVKNKLVDNPSGSPADDEEPQCVWHLYESMRFFDTFMQKRPRTSNIVKKATRNENAAVPPPADMSKREAREDGQAGKVYTTIPVTQLENGDFVIDLEGIQQQPLSNSTGIEHQDENRSPQIPSPFPSMPSKDPQTTPSMPDPRVASKRKLLKEHCFVNSSPSSSSDSSPRNAGRKKRATDDEMSSLSSAFVTVMDKMDKLASAELQSSSFGEGAWETYGMYLGRTLAQMPEENAIRLRKDIEELVFDQSMVILREKKKTS